MKFTCVRIFFLVYFNTTFICHVSTERVSVCCSFSSYTGCETIPSKCNSTVGDKIRAFVKANIRLEQSELAKLTSQGRPVKLWVSQWCAFYVLLIQYPFQGSHFKMSLLPTLGTNISSISLLATSDFDDQLTVAI